MGVTVDILPALKGRAFSLIFRNGTGVGLSGDFQTGDTHSANDTYDGPLTRSVILNNELANQLKVTTGDTVYIGGTLGGARQNEYTVVAVNRRFSVFLGAPTAVVHLSELQTMTGSAGSDRASMIGIRVESRANPETVANELERQHPDLSVRTQQEQFRSVFENQGPVLASAITLGVAVALPAADLINDVVTRIVGFPNLIKFTPAVLAARVGTGLCIGVLGAALAGWRLTATKPKEQLSS